MLPYFVFIVALAVTMVLIPPLMRAAVRLHTVDLPNARKVHTGAIPRVGGIAMIAGSVLPIILWVPLEREIVALLCGMAVILVFGVWDDRGDLDYRLKFFGQLVAALLVVLWGGVIIERVPILDAAPLPVYLSVPLTVLAIVGITNAINLADGLDGLAGGTTLLSLVGIALLAYLAHGTDVLMISIAVMGAILGFLRYNTYPAHVFMGDTGSQFLGFSVGVLAIMLTQKTNQVLSPALPLLLLGLAILDTLAVMLQRIYEGRSPFSPDKNHIHHKLLGLGFDHYEAVLLIYCVQSALVITAYFFRYESDVLVLTAYTSFCVVVLMLFRITGARGWRVHNHADVSVLRMGRRLRQIRKAKWFTGTPYVFVGLGMPLLLVGGSLAPGKISLDFGVAAVLVGCVTVVSWSWKSPVAGTLLRASTYVTSAFVIYLLQGSTGWPLEYTKYINGYFAILAAAVALGVRFSTERSFQVTPLDFLVVLLALIVPNLPELGLQGFDTGKFVIELIVLFYACELLISLHSRWMAVLRASALSALMVIGFRAFL